MFMPLALGVIVGVSLGLTGGGGSILAVPLLMYGLGLGLRRAVAVSLAVVGLTALYGAFLQARRGGVWWKAGVILGIGGIAGAPAGAWGGAMLREEVALTLFAGLMLVVGGLMILKPVNSADIPFSSIACRRDDPSRVKFSWSCAAKLAAAGLLAGILAGAFGVGGGFLLVPALLLVLRAEMSVALATSLVSIFLVATSGLAANVQYLGSDDWGIGALFLVGAALGMTLGLRVKRRVSEKVLSRIFGGAVICAGLWVLIETHLRS